MYQRENRARTVGTDGKTSQLRKLRTRVVRRRALAPGDSVSILEDRGVGPLSCVAVAEPALTLLRPTHPARAGGTTWTFGPRSPPRCCPAPETSWQRPSRKSDLSARTGRSCSVRSSPDSVSRPTRTQRSAGWRGMPRTPPSSVVGPQGFSQPPSGIRVIPRCSRAFRIRPRCCGCWAMSVPWRDPAVAVIGSRAASPYAVAVGERLGDGAGEPRHPRHERPGTRRRLCSSSRDV